MKAIALLATLAAMQANATVTAILSNGVTCNGGPVANSTAVTPTFKVSLCITSDRPLCGISYRFDRIGAGGEISVKSRVDPLQQDLNDAAPAFPFAIAPRAAPRTHHDLGFTMIDIRHPLPATKLLVATYSLSVKGSKPGTSYSFRLIDAGVALDPDGRCGRLPDGFDKFKSYPVVLPVERPITATFTLNKK